MWVLVLGVLLFVFWVLGLGIDVGLFAVEVFVGFVAADLRCEMVVHVRICISRGIAVEIY